MQKLWNDILNSGSSLLGRWVDSRLPSSQQPVNTAPAKTESVTPPWLWPVVIGAGGLLLVVALWPRRA